MTVPTVVATETVADLAPATLGSNTTSIVHEEPDAIVPDGAHVPPLMEKSDAAVPVTEMPPDETEIAPLPAFVTVTV